MTFPEEELPDVARAANAVVQEARDAGVWVGGGGLKDHEETRVVAMGDPIDSDHVARQREAFSVLAR